MRRNPDLLAGTILRMERLRQGAEQKAVCYGLCVPSYLCKIEQGAVHPNPDLLSALFRRLGVDYTQDEARLRPLEEDARREAEKGGGLVMRLGLLLGLMAGIALW